MPPLNFPGDGPPQSGSESPEIRPARTAASVPRWRVTGPEHTGERWLSSPAGPLKLHGSLHQRSRIDSPGPKSNGRTAGASGAAGGSDLPRRQTVPPQREMEQRTAYTRRRATRIPSKHGIKVNGPKPRKPEGPRAVAVDAYFRRRTNPRRFQSSRSPPPARGYNPPRPQS